MIAYKAKVCVSDGYEEVVSWVRYFHSRDKANSWAKWKQEDYNLSQSLEGGEDFARYYVEKIEVED